MKSPINTVPTNPAALSTWATDFEARHGVPPMAGGETFGAGVAAVATPPAPAPAPAPAAAPAAAQPAPAATPAPTPGAPDPAAAQPGAAPVAPGGEGAAAAPTPPDWAQTLIERMDEIAPPVIDPLAAELFGQPTPAAPQQPAPGGFSPEQLAAAQAAGLGLPPTPQAMPAVPPLAGQPAVPPQGVPQGAPGDERAFVDQLIDQRAEQVAQRMIRERVDPYIAGQEVQRRRAEAVALTQDYPEFRDPAYQSSISQRARGWAQQILGSPEAAGEPGFLELCHLAAKQLEAMQQERPAVPAPGGEVPIETPGGGNPGSAVPQPDQMAANIVAASPGRGLSKIWV